MRRTPPLGARGIYQVKAPFVVPSTKIFMCYAIRSFKDLYELGQDVYGEFYAPIGLTTSDFYADEDENAAIITLISDENDIVYVPDTYILSFPDMGEVKYQRIVLSVELGLLPDYLDFGYTIEELQGVMSQVIGVEPVVEVHSAPYAGLVTPADHQTMEANRLSQIELGATDRAKYLQQRQLNQDLVEKIQRLEQIVIDNNLLD